MSGGGRSPALRYSPVFVARATPAGLAMFYYDSAGNVTSSTNESGVEVAAATDASTNYSLPGVITPGGQANLATSISYSGSWAVTSVTGANGANATTSYDLYNRPTSSKVPDGAVTTYAYTYLPNTLTATLGGRWTRTTLDGFGRTTKVETGHDSTTVSVAETEYAPCACSPLGKLSRTSRPHAPGGAALWTTYTYDGSGRTLTVTLPDGSVSRYEYTGNTTKATDPAGKWKKQTTDVFGNLVIVTEPDWSTTYTYNVIDKLTRVDMPRPYGGGTYNQVRTFTYPTYLSLSPPGWVILHDGWPTLYSILTSETNPETGTITYQYDANNRLTTKTDARGRQTFYTYDAIGRVTQQSNNLGVVGAHPINYHYDNPVDAQFTQNSWGRLTGVEFDGPSQMRLQYLYSYTQTGHVSAQRLTVTPSGLGGGSPLVAEASYGWDNEGRMTSLQEPASGPLDTYSYDAMGRLATGGATYGPAGELLTFNGVNRTYNNLGQLTRMTKSGVMDIEYRYTAGQNNGRVSQSMDYMTGEEVTYTYDALNRLSMAETTAASWGNAYAYDGWGNLLSKTVTKGTAPSMSQSYDPSLNMPAGSPLPSAWQDPAHYDVDGRSLDGTAELSLQTGQVSYDPSGKKVVWMGSAWLQPCEVYFHSITGQRLARYRCGNSEWTDDLGNTHRDFYWSLADRTQHIGGQLTSWNGEDSTTDRLGSVRAKGGERYTYYPYGEVKSATTCAIA